MAAWTPELRLAAANERLRKCEDMDYPLYLSRGLYGGREGMSLAEAEAMAAAHRRDARRAFAAPSPTVERRAAA